MENLVISDKEDGEVDDASSTTNPPVWKKGQEKTENSKRATQAKQDLNLALQNMEIFTLDGMIDNDSVSMLSSSTKDFETLDDLHQSFMSIRNNDVSQCCLRLPNQTSSVSRD